MTPTRFYDIPATAEQVIYAKDQPEYNQLPALKYPDGMVITRWRLTWRERLHILFCSDVYISKLTFNQPLQPMKVGVSIEEVQ